MNSIRFTYCSSLVLVVFLLIGCTSTPDEFAGSRELIAEALADGVASVSVAVARDGEVIWEEGFGWANREKEVAASENTSYSLASITKPMTSTALMILVERGLVDLDRPINEYLAEDAGLQSPLGHLEEATVRRVASHTSGLPLHYQFFYEDEQFRPPPREETISRYGKLLTLPAELYNYSNLGYGVLDHLITRVSGKPYPEFLRDEVFAPLGLSHTAINPPQISEDLVAVRYSSEGNPLPFYDFDHPGGSAAYSSAHDLIRFALFHMNGPSADQPSILSDATRIAMKQPDEGRSYALGWSRGDAANQPATNGHSGGMGGVSTLMTLVPERNVALVVLSNSSSRYPSRIQRMLLHELLPDDFPVPAAPERNSSEPAEFVPTQELLGEWGGEIETYQGNRSLALRVEAFGRVQVRFQESEWIALNEVQFEDGFLRGHFPADIGTEDASRRPHNLRLYLKLRGDRLNGACTALSLPAEKIGNALSHWVELTKQ